MRFENFDLAGFADWLKDRPPVIQEMAAQCPPDRLYRLRATGHRVVLASYSEDRTVTVAVSGQYNLVAFERNVFGVSIDDLVECALPDSDEPVGSMDLPVEKLREIGLAVDGLPPLVDKIHRHKVDAS